MAQLYDAIGVGYTTYRRPDPRIGALIAEALGSLAPIVNVGAGAGAYEPRDRAVIAVEPSSAMIQQRTDRIVPVVRASATALPFRDGAFAAALAVLTIHHWPDRARGVAELARVARERIVFLTYDPTSTGFWVVDDYFPAIRALDRRSMPQLAELRPSGGRMHVRTVPIPHDCTDGFLGAYWRRPHAYLDPGVRSAISGFARADGIEAGLERLRRDLEDGTWERRYGHLRAATALDLGYRLVTIDL